MHTIWIRISDEIDHYITVTLHDILSEISYGCELNWVILDLDGVGPLGKNLSNPDFIKKVTDAKQGVPITWEDLNTIFNDMCIFDITLIAFKETDVLHHYNSDQEMQQNCDVIIEMFDSSWWEVVAKIVI